MGRVPPVSRHSAAAVRRACCALLCGAALLVAGCHNNNLTSGYGIAWITLTDSPGDFTTYTVNVNSITLTRSDGYVATALSTIETVDLTKLHDISELWGTATVPTGTYVSASIVLDYTSAVIAVMVNGRPVNATVTDTDGKAVTQQTITVNFDKTDTANQLVIAPTYASTSAQRLAFDVNLFASTKSVDLSTSPPTVQVVPYVTAAIAPADNKPIRVRGPLINSNVTLGTYTVYERPFHDVENNLGSLTLFTTPDTVFTTNGTALQGTQGLTQLSQSSAGSTVTAAYTTYQPTATPTATAGKFTALYVVAGSTLEDVYTSGIEGDVVARSGNTLTLQGATLTLNDGVSTYYPANTQVIVSGSTLVTADDTTLTNLKDDAIAVGQHIIARGLITSETSTTVVLDATGTTNTNTGSVRLISTHLWGSIVSAVPGSVVLDLQTIEGWPVSDYTFTGNGSSTAGNPLASAFVVNTGVLTLPDTTAGDPLWIDGSMAPFGAAPPAFTASSVNSEASVQTVGTTPTSPTPLSCGQGSFDCIPASLRVTWTGSGTNKPFSVLTSTGMTIDLGNSLLSTAVIVIGPETIAMSSLPASPPILPTAVAAPVTANTNTSGSITVTLPPVFLPAYSYGGVTSTAADTVNVFNTFSTYETALVSAIAATPVVTFEAQGTYDRSTNTFYALTANVVL